MPEVTVNGETVEAEEGELVFELLRRLDIEVPHFCYHPELSLAGACRMCMVEMDGEVDISCTRRVEDEMEIVTDSEEVEDTRKSILEFMLLNHPLDCPVCDKGGECPLQDYTMGYGPEDSRFHGNKRTFPKLDLGELLTQRQNRCILCYRCTRFYQEEAGREDFRVIERGNDAFVGKQPGGQLESELSGNMVDICPTGTIVTKPYLHKSRPWEQEPVESISGMDPIQAPIIADVRGEDITRIRPQQDPDFPKPWIDDRTRFVHEYNSLEEDRVRLPVDDTYFDRFDRVQEIFDGADSDTTAGVISSDRTLEEQFMFRKVFYDSFDSQFVSPYPDPGDVSVSPIDFNDLMDSDFILVAGTNFRNQYPMLTPFLRTAARNGAKIAYLTYWGNELTIEPDVFLREGPEDLLKRMKRLSNGEANDPTDEAVLEQLDQAENPAFVSCEGYSLGQELTKFGLRWDTDWNYLRLSPGANSKISERVFREIS
ncbi:MAG: 2Fe-2S iron-sulfur cluster-binding protein, partial [bacterium]